MQRSLTSKSWLMCIAKCYTIRRGKGKDLHFHLFHTHVHWSKLCISFFFCRTVLRQLATVYGTYGMVSPREKTCLLHPVVGRFQTEDIIRVVQPAEVVRQVPWELEHKKSCGLRISFDDPHGKSLGTFTVRVCWRTSVYRDEAGFVERHYLYWGDLFLDPVYL